MGVPNQDLNFLERVTGNFISPSKLLWVFEAWCKYESNLSGIILGMGSANERMLYYAMPSLIGWAHTQNEPCLYLARPSVTILNSELGHLWFR